MEMNEAIAFSTPEITERDIAAVVDVLRSGWLTTGEVSAELESRIANYTGAKHAVAVSSCTAALECALAFAGIEGVPVAIPTWTFASTANVPARLRGNLTLIDVDPETLMIDANLLEVFLRQCSRPPIVIPVSFAGVPVDERIFALCRDYGATVIEDCAHALGSFRKNGSHSGSEHVLAGAFSFYATKNLTSAEGGMLITEDDKLASFARRYRLHGLSADAWKRYLPGATPSYNLEMHGTKANLPDVLAALALSQFERFEQGQARRRTLSEYYLREMGRIDSVRALESMSTGGSANHLFVAVLDKHVNRDQLLARMTALGVSCSVHFRPLHTFDVYCDTPLISSGVADQFRNRVFSLPLRSNLTLDQASRVMEVLESAIRGHASL